MMIQGQPSSLSGIVTAQASSLSGLASLFGLGDCTEDADGNIACDTSDPTTGIDNPVITLPSSGGGSAPVTITAPSSNLIGQCAVLNPDGSCQTYYAAPLSAAPSGSGVPAGTTAAAGSLASVLASLFSGAASVANTALKSTTQTCQVINGQTVCTTSSTGGGSPTTSSVSGLGGISMTTLLLIGIGAVVLMSMGKK